MQKLKEISRTSLALRNGRDKEEIWVAYNGLVYDVSSSRLWKKGQHYEHLAGQDLSAEMIDAPHTETVFSKFEIVGKLV
jgi:predicted heme/steroid binding protein